MTQSKQKWQCRVIDGKTIIDSEIVVHRFLVEWSDDAIVTAAAPLYEWEQSEVGKWVMEHAVEKPRWERAMHINTYNQEFAIIARLTEPDQIFFRLKFT